MTSTKEEIQLSVKQICSTKEDVISYAQGWLMYVNTSQAKKQELQRTIEEVKWILEAGRELQSGLDKFLGVNKNGK